MSMTRNVQSIGTTQASNRVWICLTDYVGLWTKARCFLRPEKGNRPTNLHYWTYLPKSRSNPSSVHHNLFCLNLINPPFQIPVTRYQKESVVTSLWTYINWKVCNSYLNNKVRWWTPNLVPAKCRDLLAMRTTVKICPKVDRLICRNNNKLRVC